ncbi:MAG TPA: hemerythrin domain-containing protein [Polyangiaceae bacterium]|jgi:hemerythrin-like domain-containing protein|nr:hemerythrin domain-containing protein [Polyangiaceae bacterium]
MADHQPSPSPHTKAADIKAHLNSDHRDLEQLLARLTSAIEGADSSELCEQWTHFEQNLRDHLDTEERCLFPLVAHEHRGEVASLRSEHQHIRQALSELGVAVDLHTLRKAAVDELIVYLREHAQREDRALYRWIERSPTAERGLRHMFARRARWVPLDK